MTWLMLATIILEMTVCALAVPDEWIRMREESRRRRQSWSEQPPPDIGLTCRLPSRLEKPLPLNDVVVPYAVSLPSSPEPREGYVRMHCGPRVHAGTQSPPGCPCFGSVKVSDITASICREPPPSPRKTQGATTPVSRMIPGFKDAAAQCQNQQRLHETSALRSEGSK